MKTLSNYFKLKEAKEKRREYYDALQAYQQKRDIKPTIELILKEYKQLRKEIGDHKQKKV